MVQLIDKAAHLRKVLASPREQLMMVPILSAPLIIHSSSIIRIDSLSEFLHIIYHPHPTYVSTVFNKKIKLKESIKLILKREYDGIYYDILQQ